MKCLLAAVLLASCATSPQARIEKDTRLWLENNKPPIVVRFTLQAFDVRSADEVAVQTIQRASRYQETEGTRRHVEHEVRQRETWLRTPDGWKIRKVDQIDLKNRKRWIDGELQQPPQ